MAVYTKANMLDYLREQFKYVTIEDMSTDTHFHIVMGVIGGRQRIKIPLQDTTDSKLYAYTMESVRWGLRSVLLPHVYLISADKKA